MKNLYRTSIKRVIPNAAVGLDSEVIVPTRELRDAFAGQPAYITGIRLLATAAVTNGSGGVINANRELERSFGNVRLEVGSHKYLRGRVDGDDLRLFNMTRFELNTPGTIPATALANGANAGLSLASGITFERPFVREEYRYDLCIPLAALGSPDAVFAFTPTSSLATNLTLTSMTNVVVWFDIVFLDKLRAPNPWALVVQPVQDEDAVVTPKGGFEFLLLAGRHPTAGSFLDYESIGPYSLWLDAEPVFSGFTATELKANVTAYERGQNWLSYAFREENGVLPILTCPRDAAMSKWNRGVVTLKVENRSANFTPTRFLWLEQGWDEIGGNYDADYLRVLGVKDGVIDTAASRSTPANPGLPRRILTTDLGRFGQVRDKSRRVLGRGR